MDTRTKIVSPEEFARQVGEWQAEGTAVAVVAGSFDPLLASHARLAQQARPAEGKLAVIVTEPADPILESRARAELAASLQAIDLVTTGAVEGLAATVDWDETHAAISTEFVRHVLDRMS